MITISSNKALSASSYSSWREYRKLKYSAQKIQPNTYCFLYSIIIEVNASSELLAIEKTMTSITSQTYKNIEIIIINLSNLSINNELIQASMSLRGIREIKEVDKSDFFDTNKLDRLARGDFLFMASPGTSWDPGAFMLINHTINLRKNTPDLIACDYDIETASNQYDDPVFFTEWDPLVYSENIESAAIGISHTFINKYCRVKFNSIKDWFEESIKDKADINVANIYENIVHLPCNKDNINKMHELNLDDLKGILISIIIPNKDNLHLLKKCLQFLESDRIWNLELIIVDNNSTDKETWDYYDQLEKKFNAKINIMPHKFNFSKMINSGVAVAKGSALVFLNNDVEFTQPNQIEELILEALRPEVGVVGSLLLNEDFSINHAGVMLTQDGMAGHVLRGAKTSDKYVIRYIKQKRNYQALTGALMATRKDVFEKVGGMDEVNLPIEYNDTDFCLKLRMLNLQVVCLPLKGIIHKESSTRKYTENYYAMMQHEKAKRTMLNRWPDCFRHEPFANPHLNILETSSINLNYDD